MAAGRARRRGLVLALAAGALLGAASAVVGMPDLVRIPIVSPHGKGDPPEAGLFSHWEHQRYRCHTCHPAVFPKARRGFTHDDMDEGRYCAACHDGRRAWAVDGDDTECETCHVE